ncbi:MAG TPA: hypothetical protein VI431_03870 [Candidatus Acidoferrum sp.]
MQDNMRKLLFTLLAGLLLFTTRSAAQSFNFTSIDVPCSACPGGIARRTALGGINPAGDIVGTYSDAVGKQHGFLLSRGQFTTIDVPGALVGATGSLPTVARGIGPSGDIVGQFTAPYNPPVSTSVGFDSPAYCPAAGSTACIKGFLYSRGQFSAVLFPGHPGAIPGRIGPDGSMYGCYHDFDTMGSMFSAAWTRFGDTSIAANGGALSDPSLSFPNSMHGGATPNGSIVTGFYVDMAASPNHTHGYFLQNGVLQTYDVPDSKFTVVWDINPGEEAVGTYIDQAGRQHGFVQLPDGSAPITLDVPSAPPFNSVLTLAMGINPGGAIVGQYRDTSGHTHGFLTVPAEQ